MFRNRPSVCIRRGDPRDFLKDCPQPYRAVSDPKFSPNVIKYALKPVVHFAESPAENEA